MRTKMTLAAILVAVLAAFAGACGGGGGDPATTVEDFFTAVTEGDGGAACDLITEEGLQVIGQAAGASGSCEETIEQVGPLLEQTEIELVSAETVEEDGDTATVEATVSALGEEDTSEITLVDDGGWKIEGDDSQ